MSKFTKIYRSLGGVFPPKVLFQISEVLLGEPQPGSASTEEARISYLKKAISLMEKHFDSEFIKKYRASVNAYAVAVELAKAARSKSHMSEVPSLRAASEMLKYKTEAEKQKIFAEKMLKEETQKKK